MRGKMTDAFGKSVGTLQAAAWRAVTKLGYNDVQEKQWREMQSDPYLMQEYIIRAAHANGYVTQSDIDAFASKFIADMMQQFGD